MCFPSLFLCVIDEKDVLVDLLQIACSRNGSIHLANASGCKTESSRRDCLNEEEGEAKNVSCERGSFQCATVVFIHRLESVFTVLIVAAL